MSAVREAKRRGFRVSTNTTFFGQDDASTVRDVLDFLNDDLKVDVMQISPGYAYERAPDQEHFLGVERTRAIFREAFADGRRKKWRLNHSPLFLDFLEGVVRFPMHCLGNPLVLGARLAASLLPAQRWVRAHVPRPARHHGVVPVRTGPRPALRELHGPLRYEPTAVIATTGSLRQSLRAASDTLLGQRVG